MPDWNAPPTEEEQKAAGWDIPPTPEELGEFTPPREIKPPTVEPGLGSQWIQKAGEGLVPGYNRMVAGMEAGVDTLAGNDRMGSNFSERFQNWLRGYQGMSRKTQRESPVSSAFAQAAGSVPTALMTAGAAPAVGAVRAAVGAGGLYAAGDTDADAGWGEQLYDTAKGMILGGVFGRALKWGAEKLANLDVGLSPQPKPAAPEVPAGTATLELQPRPARSMIEPEPIPSAQRLRDRGVNLTIGQSNPRSALGQLEEASTSLKSVGAQIKGQRDNAVAQWQNLMLNEARAPGAPKVIGNSPVTQQLDEIYKGFRPAYDQFRGEMVYPAIHARGKGTPLQTYGKSQGAFDKAVSDPNVLATAEERALVGRYLTNQLTLIPQRRGAVGQVELGDILAMRSNVRDAARSANHQGKFAVAELLDNAEVSLTKTIESQIRPETAAALRAVDAQYWRYKILEGAVASSRGSPSGFMPTQVENEIARVMSRGEYARGGGGDTRQLADDARQVFQQVVPPTGARLLGVGPLGEYMTGPMAWRLNVMRQPRLPAPSSASPSPVEVNGPWTPGLVNQMRSWNAFPARPEDEDMEGRRR